MPKDPDHVEPGAVVGVKCRAIRGGGAPARPGPWGVRSAIVSSAMATCGLDGRILFVTLKVATRKITSAFPRHRHRGFFRFLKQVTNGGAMPQPVMGLALGHEVPSHIGTAGPRLGPGPSSESAPPRRPCLAVLSS